MKGRVEKKGQGYNWKTIWGHWHGKQGKNFQEATRLAKGRKAFCMWRTQPNQAPERARRRRRRRRRKRRRRRRRRRGQSDTRRSLAIYCTVSD
jgi:hypothetical protein